MARQGNTSRPPVPMSLRLRAPVGSPLLSTVRRNLVSPDIYNEVALSWVSAQVEGNRFARDPIPIKVSDILWERAGITLVLAWRR